MYSGVSSDGCAGRALRGKEVRFMSVSWSGNPTSVERRNYVDLGITSTARKARQNMLLQEGARRAPHNWDIYIIGRTRPSARKFPRPLYLLLRPLGRSAGKLDIRRNGDAGKHACVSPSLTCQFHRSVRCALDGAGDPGWSNKPRQRHLRLQWTALSRASAYRTTTRQHPRLSSPIRRPSWLHPLPRHDA